MISAVTCVGQLHPQTHLKCHRRRSSVDAGTVEGNRNSHVQGDERLTINVSGKRFETYKKTLAFDQDTLLGNAQRRAVYLDAASQEICLDRNSEIFHNILFYYQSKGILCKPNDVTDDQFRQELQFYAINHGLSSLEDDDWMFDEGPDEMTESESSSWRSRTWLLVEHPHSSRLARCFAQFSFCAIIVSIITYCLETVPSIRFHRNVSLQRQVEIAFKTVEAACIVWFVVEYLLRVYATRHRWRFIRSPMGIIDLSVVVPYLITLVIYSPSSNDVVSLAFLRIIRLIRVLRILKLSRYSRGMKVLGRTVTQSVDQLKALSLCLLMAILLLSSAFYYLEGYGSENSTFTSIPASFWFTIITMTTVGYGDMVPQTICGRLLTSLCVFSGVIILLCLPTPVFIAHFNKFYGMMSKKAQQRSLIVEVHSAGDVSGPFDDEFDGLAAVVPLLRMSRQDLEREQECNFKQQEMNNGFLTPIWVRKPHQT